MLSPAAVIGRYPPQTRPPEKVGRKRLNVRPPDDSGPAGVLEYSNLNHYEFDRNLANSDVAWIAEGRTGFVDVVPAPVGMGVRLAP